MKDKFWYFIIVAFALILMVVSTVLTEPTQVQQFTPDPDSSQELYLGATANRDCVWFWIPGRNDYPWIEGFLTIGFILDSINQVSADVLDSLTVYARPVYKIMNSRLASRDSLSAGDIYVVSAVIDSLAICSLLDGDDNELYAYPFTTAYGQLMGLCVVAYFEGTTDGDSFRWIPFMNIQ